MSKIVRVKVVPNSKVESVADGDPLRVKVKEPPEGGRANLAVVRLLSKHFGCDVKIIGGRKSRRKTVAIET